MRRRVLLVLFVGEPLIELLWWWSGSPINDPRTGRLRRHVQGRWMKCWYDSQYGVSDAIGDYPDGNFELEWRGPLKWERAKGRASRRSVLWRRTRT